MTKEEMQQRIDRIWDDWSTRNQITNEEEVICSKQILSYIYKAAYEDGVKDRLNGII